MASSTATTIEEATPVREDLDAKSISSLTTVQASNKVSPGDTVADISRNEDEEDISTRSFVSSDPGYRGQPAPPADEVFADASASDAGPPVANAFLDPAAADGQSNLTVSDDDELDPDLRAQVQAAHAAIRAAKKEQLKRRFQNYNAMSDEQEKTKKPRRDDADDGGGDSKPPPAAGGGALAVK